MKRNYENFESIDITKDENGSYIVTDPDMFDSTYNVEVLDRSHSDGTKTVKEKPVFLNGTQATYNCKRCGKKVNIKFRRSNLENHKTLLCNDCMRIERYGSVSPFAREEVVKKAQETMFERYGGATLSKNSSLRAKTLATNKERYGSECSLVNPKIREKSKATTRKRFGVDYALQNENVRAKCVKTLYEKHGVNYVWESEELKAKADKTLKERYGVDNAMQSEELRAKAANTKLEKYGDENYNNRKKSKETLLNTYGDENYNNREKFYKTIEENYGSLEEYNKVKIEKTKNSLIDKYGEDNPMKIKEFKEKAKLTNFQKYGYDSIFRVPEVREKIRKIMLDKYGCQFLKPKYEYYDGTTFDSSWELCLWIYATEHNEPIERYSGEGFEYICNGKTRHYYPDFVYKGEIIEIKGQQFIDPDSGEMINLYDKDDQSYEAKRQIALSNGIKILFENDIKFAIDYVNEKYGPNYVYIWKIDKNSFPYETTAKSQLNGYFDVLRHFHKSIYHAKTKGCNYSPFEAWFDKKFVKSIVDNRIEQSNYKDKLTPRSIIQGFSATGKAKKVSVFSPQRASDIISKYLSDAKQIFDPFSGFSGRMLGAIMNNIPYIGQDVNLTHVNESNDIIRFLINKGKNFLANVSCKDIFDSYGEYDCLFTCSPYGNKEDWGNENQQVLTCDEWIDECLKRFKCRKYVFVVDNTEKYKNYIVDVLENKSHFGENTEKIILIDKSNNNQNVLNPFYFIMPIPMSYWAFVNGAMFQAYTMNGGLGVTPFDKFDDKGYAIHPDDEVGVTPFDLD